MSASSAEVSVPLFEVRKIREDLDMLVVLYKKLVDRMVPVEEPSEEERAALGERDEFLGEDAIARALG